MATRARATRRRHLPLLALLLAGGMAGACGGAEPTPVATGGPLAPGALQPMAEGEELTSGGHAGAHAHAAEPSRGPSSETLLEQQPEEEGLIDVLAGPQEPGEEGSEEDAPPPMPASRASAPAYTPPSGLANAEQLHRATLRLPLGSESPSPTIEEAIQGIVAQLEAVAASLTSMDQAYRAAVEVQPSLEGDALMRRADAYDEVASRVNQIPFPMPTELERELGAVSAEAQEQIRELVRMRVHGVLEVRAWQLFCIASELYGRAARLMPVGSRPGEQRLRYGAPFIASCPELSTQ